MPAGRPPKPTFLHIVSGTYRGHRHRKRLDREPRPVGDLGEPPVHLSEAQRRIWSQQLRDAPLGLLKRLDGGVYEVWVVACSIHQMAVTQLNELGAGALTGPDGQLARLLVRIASQQAQLMLKFGGELGFSPSSCTRISIDPRPVKNPFDEFA